MASTDDSSTACSSEQQDSSNQCPTPRTITPSTPSLPPQATPTPPPPPRSPTPPARIQNLLQVRLPPTKRPEYFPQPGKTFLICTHDQRGLVLELKEGTVRAVERRRAGLGIAWRCVKTQNWYGFVNTVSGMHLGHDGKGAFRATLETHEVWARFAVDRHPAGGYVLMSPDHIFLFSWLHEVAISSDGKGALIIANEGGAAWDFIEMEDVDVLCQFAKGEI